MNKKKIGIISPANNVLSIFPKRKEIGIKNLEEIGYEVIFSKNGCRINDCYKKSLKERLEEINEILNQEPDIIMASIGGYTSIQLLDKLDYKKINEKKSIFCGFSDATALLLAIYTKTKKEVLYGPVYTVNLCDYGGIDEYTKKYLLDCIEGKKIIYKASNYSIKEFIDWKELEEKEIIKKKTKKGNDWKVVKEGKASGKLIGGNLSTLILIIGTEYLKEEEFDNSILFLEDCDTNISKFCSFLDSLRIKGIFNKINGLIVGKFDSDELNKEIYGFLKDYLIEYNIPVVCNVDFGHIYPILTFPIGRKASLECNKKEIKLSVDKK